MTAAAGIALPADRSFRELYGAAQYPFSLQADFELHRHVLAFGGYGYLGRTGRTQASDPTAGLSGDPIKFRMHSFKAGLLYVLPFGRVTLTAGGGAGFHTFRERWEAAGVSTAGNRAGFTAQGGIEFELTRSISLTGRVEYMNARIHAKSTVENNVNLDRIDVSLGLCLRLDRLLRK